MTSPEVAQRPGISLTLPPEFAELPSGEVDEATFRSLAAEIAARFGLDPDAEIDQGLAETTAMLLAAGAASSAGGSTFTAAGFFRSPDDPRRPLMVLVSVFYVESSHPSIAVAIAGLEEMHRQKGAAPEIVDLSAGRAVVTTSRVANSVGVNEGQVDIVQHSIVAWISHPAGEGIAGVAVSSNNSEDWVHVEDMARGLFETFEWEDAPTPVGAG